MVMKIGGCFVILFFLSSCKPYGDYKEQGCWM